MHWGTPLGRAIAPQLAAHPGTSGLYLLGNGCDAFAARMLSAKAAERTLDVQYYIWESDKTGMLILNVLHAAATRGLQRCRRTLDPCL